MNEHDQTVSNGQETQPLPPSVADGAGVAPTHPGARAALWLALLLVVAHSGAIALWVSPPNILKDRIGYQNLKSYVLPMFDQAWSVFAPEADNGYSLFEVRATLRSESGDESQTDWVKVTAREVAPQLRYHPFPSRTLLITDRLASDQLRLFNALSEAQKKVVHDSGVQVATTVQTDLLLDAATNDAEREAALTYSRTEVAVEAYLSGIAEAIWGDRATAIQYRQNTVFVPTYQKSKGSRQVTGGYDFVSNFRPIAPLTSGERETFNDYADKWKIR